MRPFIEKQCQTFGGRVIVPKNLVQVTVIKRVNNQAFARAKFAVNAHKAAFIKRRTLQLHRDDIVMAMQART